MKSPALWKISAIIKINQLNLRNLNKYTSIFMSKEVYNELSSNRHKIIIKTITKIIIKNIKVHMIIIMPLNNSGTNI